MQHIKSIHEHIKHPCNQCDYKATLKGSLMKHIKSMHKVTLWIHNKGNKHRVSWKWFILILYAICTVHWMVWTVHNWRAVFSTPVQYWAGLSSLSRAASDPPQYHNIIAQCQCVEWRESSNICAAGVSHPARIAPSEEARKLSPGHQLVSAQSPGSEGRGY